MPPILDPGFHHVAKGTVATVVTSLHMLKPAPLRPSPAGPWKLQRWHDPEPAAYRDLFRRVGEDWLWFSRLVMEEAELLGTIHAPGIEIYRVQAPEGSGLLELDFRQAGECELAFLGLTVELTGSGAGRWLMNRALEMAWSRDIGRMWVHTCTMDHPAALGFYIRSGFIPFSRRIEIAPDPRISGHLPESAAPHVPVLRG